MVDRWDLMGASGAACVIGGVAALCWPLGLILLGLLLCVLYYLGER